MPSIPPVLTHSEVLEAALSARKLILFCGSGVSQFAPTSLPSGQELRDDFLASVAASFVAMGQPDPGIPTLGSLPLELMLGLFSRQKPRHQLRPLINSIAAYFAAATFNRIHLLAAALLLIRPGAWIVTTNYDTAFERALRALTARAPSAAIARPVVVYPIRRLARVLPPTSNAIYKIHGCALRDRPEDLILTTSQESSGLPAAFLSILPQLFRDSLVIFLGYSASEPDCMEALLEAADFEGIWYARDRATYIENPRAQVIMSIARNPRLALDLMPLVQCPARELHPAFLGQWEPLLDDPALSQSLASARKPVVGQGLALFRRFASLPTIKSSLHSLIEAFLWDRDFRAVETLLPLYRRAPRSSYYWFLFWKASLTRDRNQDWHAAHALFEHAAKAASSRLESASAEVEYLGLQTLLSQPDQVLLQSTELSIRELVASLRKASAAARPSNRVAWLRLLGLAQKMLAQNLTYQVLPDPNAAHEALRLCEEAAANLRHSRDLNARIETQRFAARAHLRLFSASRDITHLTAALAITHKVQLLFSLLGMTMGTINAKRQYALLLCLNGRIDQAYDEVRQLNHLLTDSPDKLSRLKVAALELLLARRWRYVWRLPGAGVKFIALSRHYSSSRPSWRNMVSAFSWLRSFYSGHAG